MGEWDGGVLDRIGREHVVQVVGGEGGHRPLGVWAVVVDGAVYVRSWRGNTDGWHAGFRDTGRGLLAVGGERHAVTAEPVDDEVVQRAVDAAYLAKYDHGSESSYAHDMVADGARATTLRLSPR